MCNNHGICTLQPARNISATVLCVFRAISGIVSTRESERENIIALNGWFERNFRLDIWTAPNGRFDGNFYYAERQKSTFFSLSKRNKNGRRFSAGVGSWDWIEQIIEYLPRFGCFGRGDWVNAQTMGNVAQFLNGFGFWLVIVRHFALMFAAAGDSFNAFSSTEFASAHRAPSIRQTGFQNRTNTAAAPSDDTWSRLSARRFVSSSAGNSIRTRPQTPRHVLVRLRVSQNRIKYARTYSAAILRPASDSRILLLPTFTVSISFSASNEDEPWMTISSPTGRRTRDRNAKPIRSHSGTRLYLCAAQCIMCWTVDTEWNQVYDAHLRSVALFIEGDALRSVSLNCFTFVIFASVSSEPKCKLREFAYADWTSSAERTESKQ